jgi:beta-glucosidase
MVGASSQDIRLEAVISIEGKSVEPPYTASILHNYFNATAQSITKDEFETLLGTTLPPESWDAKAPLSYCDTIAQGKYKKGFSRFIYKFILLARKTCILFGKPVAANNVMFIMNLRFNQLARMSNGKIDMPMLDGILTMMNGHFWKGLWQVRKARKQKRKKEKV